MESKIQNIKLTEETYKYFCSDYEGICLKCRSTQSGCEPDARKYVCDNCNANSVYGTEMLMVMGRIEFVESSEDENVNS